MSRAAELREKGAIVRPCKLCGRDVIFAQDEKGTEVCLDPTPPVYSLWADATKCTRMRGSLVSHHATCREFHKAKAAEAQQQKGTA